MNQSEKTPGRESDPAGRYWQSRNLMTALNVARERDFFKIAIAVPTQDDGDEHAYFPDCRKRRRHQPTA